MSSRKVVGAAVLVLALLIGGRLYQLGGQEEGSSRRGRGGAGAKVAVDLVRMGTLSFNYEIVGNVESVQTVDVVARTVGLLETVPYLAGDQVEKGDVLAQVDDSQAEANLYKLQSDLANARFTYYQFLNQRELTDVQAQGGVKRSQAEYAATVTQGKTAVAQARSSLEQAKAQLRQAEVTFQQSKVKYERMLGLQRQGFASRADLQDFYADVLSQQAAVDAQKAAVKAAETEVTNAIEQAKKESVTARTALDEAVAGTSRSKSFAQQLLAQQSLVEAAEAELQRAQLQLEDTTLRSPVDGFVSSRNLDPGALVSVGDVILTVQAGGDVWIVAALPQEIYGYVDRGAACQVKIDGLRDRLFDAYVYSKDLAVDAASRQFNIRVKLKQGDEAVKPGMFARVLLRLGPSGERLTVPSSALMDRDDERREATVFRVVDNKVEKVSVSFGPSDETKALVREGLKEGDEVVVQTAFALKDGQEVEPRLVGTEQEDQG